MVLNLRSLLKSRTSVIPPGYSLTGCIPEGTSGRALVGASFSDDSMTRNDCVSFCQGGKYPLAGVEYGRECYCGYYMANGAENTTLLPDTSCNVPCAGDPTETCGGPGTLDLYNNPSMYPAHDIPPGYRQINCRTEASNGRALTGYSFSSDEMTYYQCITSCGSQGFVYAGLEYGRECYCGNLIEGGTIADDSECNIPCAGDNSEICGGSNRLTIFSRPSG